MCYLKLLFIIGVKIADVKGFDQGMMIRVIAIIITTAMPPWVRAGGLRVEWPPVPFGDESPLSSS